MGIYEKIRALTKEKGITITALERELGFAKGSLSKIDKHMPSDDRVDRLANRLGVNADWLMGRSVEDCSYSDRFRLNLSQIIQSTDQADLQEAATNGMDTGMISRVIESNGSISLDTACQVSEMVGESLDYILDPENGVTIKSVLLGEDGPIKEIFNLMLNLPDDKQKQAAELLRVFASPAKPQ